MTEKVMLTREQADGIEHLKKRKFSDESIIGAHVRNPNGWLLDENAALNRMPLIRLVDALRSGYEVEPKYQVRDWVVYRSFDAGNVIVKIIDIQYVHSRVQFETLSGWKAIRDIERHATPEEIKSEKERRLWKSIGRKVGKFHNGDFGISYDGEHPDFVPRLIDLHSEGKLLGFYPAESFISFEEVDSE
ncbi:hypothetical protein [Psychrobacillus sp. NPDC096389]|uniref:hypothetical protein n=1 Tax=Psychrobacillus sp. NPDC096389 TaxID=3364490 RepID=UPI00382BBB5F